MVMAMVIVSWVPDHRLFADHRISWEISVVKLGTQYSRKKLFFLGSFLLFCHSFVLCFLSQLVVLPCVHCTYTGHRSLHCTRVCIKKVPSFFETGHWSGSGRPAYANGMLLPHH